MNLGSTFVHRAAVDKKFPEKSEAVLALPRAATREAKPRAGLAVPTGAAQKLSTERWTDLEHEMMAAHHWWSADELRSPAEQVWPENLPEILVRIGAWQAPAG